MALELTEEQRQALATCGSNNIAPGIQRAQAALRRDLPRLLQDPRLRGHWAAYHGDERIGIAATERQLIRECLRRGLSADAYYAGWIDPTELSEEEDVENGLCECDETAGG